MKTLDVVGGAGGKATTEVVRPSAPASPAIPHGVARPMKPRVEVGDRLRFSVPLLRQMLEAQEQAGVASETLELVNVISEADGVKILVLKRS